MLLHYPFYFVIKHPQVFDIVIYYLFFADSIHRETYGGQFPAVASKRCDKVVERLALRELAVVAAIDRTNGRHESQTN